PKRVARRSQLLEGPHWVKLVALRTAEPAPAPVAAAQRGSTAMRVPATALVEARVQAATDAQPLAQACSPTLDSARPSRVRSVLAAEMACESVRRLLPRPLCRRRSC